MLAACLLLVLATLSGTLLTLLYDRSAPPFARVCVGAVTGLAIFAMAGYLFALWLGMGALSISLAAAVMLAPFLLLFRSELRESAWAAVELASEVAQKALSVHRMRTAANILFYGALLILLAMVFARAAYATPDGIYTADRHDLGDLPLHLQVISSFAHGQNFPPQDPTFAGVRFAYPFLVDLLAAMFVKCGAGIFAAMWMQEMVLALALVGLLYYLTVLLTRDRIAGMIAPLLVLFSGGLGWAWILQDLHESPSGLIPLLGSLPHDYTIGDGSILRWGNSLTTLFVPQRSILFGVPLALVIFCQWWRMIGTDSPPDARAANTRMMFAGLFAGLLPLVHAHTFLAVMGVGACLAILFRSRWRQWAWFFAVAAVVAAPQVLWLAGGVKAQSYLGWHPGWDHGTFNVIQFWLANTGFFIPLLVIFFFWRVPGLVVSRNLVWFYVPFALCFVVPNLIKLAPWVWDNIKVLFYWYVASAPLVAWLLAIGLRQRTKWRWLSAGVLVSLVLAGALDVWRVVDKQTEDREFLPSGIVISDEISERAAPQAVVLHAPTFNSPVFLTGRRSLMGYAGWMWSRGLNDTERQADIKRMYAGDSEADSLLRSYHVDYVLIGPEEFASLKVNQQFWWKYPQVASAGPYHLFKISQ
ncbi:MAG TPA: hypothetical protein VKW06_21240 [Candidatus Angelobacter sp.]|nr:hypothetical protein [Candidatus Angelobacter sp.]